MAISCHSCCFFVVCTNVSLESNLAKVSTFSGVVFFFNCYRQLLVQAGSISHSADERWLAVGQLHNVPGQTRYGTNLPTA